MGQVRRISSSIRFSTNGSRCMGRLLRDFDVLPRIRLERPLRTGWAEMQIYAWCDQQPRSRRRPVPRVYVNPLYLRLVPTAVTLDDEAHEESSFRSRGLRLRVERNPGSLVVPGATGAPFIAGGPASRSLTSTHLLYSTTNSQVSTTPRKGVQGCIYGLEVSSVLHGGSFSSYTHSYETLRQPAPLCNLIHCLSSLLPEFDDQFGPLTLLHPRWRPPFPAVTLPLGSF